MNFALFPPTERPPPTEMPHQPICSLDLVARWCWATREKAHAAAICGSPKDTRWNALHWHCILHLRLSELFRHTDQIGPDADIVPGCCHLVIEGGDTHSHTHKDTIRHTYSNTEPLACIALTWDRTVAGEVQYTLWPAFLSVRSQTNNRVSDGFFLHNIIWHSNVSVYYRNLHIVSNILVASQRQPPAPECWLRSSNKIILYVLCWAFVKGLLLGVCLAHVGSMLGCVAPMLDLQRACVEACWAIQCLCWGHGEFVAPIMSHVGPCWAYVGPMFGLCWAMFI